MDVVELVDGVPLPPRPDRADRADAAPPGRHRAVLAAGVLAAALLVAHAMAAHPRGSSAPHALPAPPPPRQASGVHLVPLVGIVTAEEVAAVSPTPGCCVARRMSLPALEAYLAPLELHPVARAGAMVVAADGTVAGQAAEVDLADGVVLRLHVGHTGVDVPYRSTRVGWTWVDRFSASRGGWTLTAAFSSDGTVVLPYGAAQQWLATAVLPDLDGNDAG